jgi:rhamnogalacturonyl hydrolase YesR
VPCGNPDGLATGVAPENGAGGNPSVGYPPQDNFFHDPHNPEAFYLWRWICFQAPDLVLEIRAGDSVSWEASDAAALLVPALGATGLEQSDSLLVALGVGKPSGLAPIPGLRLTTPLHTLATELERLWSILAQTPSLRPSPARGVLEARRQRTPLEISRVLASAYGHKLDPVIYTQAVAISGRLRLARLDQTAKDTVPDIVRLVEPYVSGSREIFGGRVAPSNLNGLIWGEELAEATGDQRYANLVVSAANRYRIGVDGGAPPPSDPDFRTEDMFMNGSILGRAFRITGNTYYLDLLTKFLLDAHTQQDDGLFWHCRSAPYYWGRGNGFAALGFAEALTYLPSDHPDRDALLGMHVRHLNALRQRQNPSGMYLQVINFPGSYQELTATCMTGYAMARGMHRGWLDTSYRASVELAWQGISERIDDLGGVVDPCTNTGVQRSLRDYLDRPAIFGFDDRAGAMALWFATEMVQLVSIPTRPSLP